MKRNLFAPFNLRVALQFVAYFPPFPTVDRKESEDGQTEAIAE